MLTAPAGFNVTQYAGYKVVFVPVANGNPSGPPENFLTGFLAGTGQDAHGRPVGVATLPDGSLLVADDAADKIWRVSVRR